MKKRSYPLITLATWLVLLLGWQALASSGFISQAKLPSLTQVLYRAVDMVKNGYNYTPLWVHLGVSLARLLAGLILAIVTAIPLGLVSGYAPKIRAGVNSLVNFFRPLPPSPTTPSL